MRIIPNPGALHLTQGDAILVASFSANAAITFILEGFMWARISVSILIFSSEEFFLASVKAISKSVLICIPLKIIDLSSQILGLIIMACEGNKAVSAKLKASSKESVSNLLKFVSVLINDSHIAISSSRSKNSIDSLSHPMKGNGSTDAGLHALSRHLGASPIRGSGDGMSDDIHTTIDGRQPARVADGEAMVSPERVKALGNGSTDAGAKKLYTMMDKIRQARTGSTKQGKQIKADKYLPT